MKISFGERAELRIFTSGKDMVESKVTPEKCLCPELKNLDFSSGSK